MSDPFFIPRRPRRPDYGVIATFVWLVLALVFAIASGGPR